MVTPSADDVHSIVLVSHYKHNLRNTTRVLQQMISILSGYVSSLTLLLKILSVIFIFDPSKIVSISKRKKVLPYQKSFSALKVSERFVLTLSELLAAIFSEFQSEAKYNISCSTNYRPICVANLAVSLVYHPPSHPFHHLFVEDPPQTHSEGL